jgi:hypothetical protein
MVVVGGLVEGFGVALVYPFIVAAVFLFALALLGVRQLAGVDQRRPPQ